MKILPLSVALERKWIAPPESPMDEEWQGYSWFRITDWIPHQSPLVEPIIQGMLGADAMVCTDDDRGIAVYRRKSKCKYPE